MSSGAVCRTGKRDDCRCRYISVGVLCRKDITTFKISNHIGYIPDKATKLLVSAVLSNGFTLRLYKTTKEYVIEALSDRYGMAFAYYAPTSEADIITAQKLEESPNSKCRIYEILTRRWIEYNSSSPFYSNEGEHDLDEVVVTAEKTKPNQP